MKRLTLVLALLLLVGCSTPASAPSTPSAAPTDDLGIVTAAITDALGTSNRKVERVDSIKISKDDVITVRWQINDNVTDELLIRGARSDATDILEAIEGSGVGYDSVHLLGLYPLVDKKGNTKTWEVVDATYDSLELMDVNWDNFDGADVWDLADKYVLHPSFQ